MLLQRVQVAVCMNACARLAQIVRGSASLESEYVPRGSDSFIVLAYGPKCNRFSSLP